MLTRREFLQHTVAGGALTALGGSLSPSLDARAVKWPIGCFNRPWTTWSYDEALKQIKQAGYRRPAFSRGRRTNRSSARMRRRVPRQPEARIAASRP